MSMQHLIEKPVTEDEAFIAQMLLDVHGGNPDPFYKDVCRLASVVLRTYYAQQTAP